MRVEQEMMGRPRVVVVDDEPVVLVGIRHILEESCEIVAEARDGWSGIELVRNFRPDILITEIQLQGISGIELAKKVREIVPDIKILAFSSSKEEELVLEAIRIGVSSYLTKDQDAESLIQAVAAISRGEAFLPPVIARTLIVGITEDRFKRTPKDGLTPREETVLKMVAQGASYKEIANKIGISQRTVGNHINNIYSKLGISRRAEAVLVAVKMGLVEFKK